MTAGVLVGLGFLELLSMRIPVERLAHRVPQGDVAEVADGGGAMADFDIGTAATTGLDVLEEVAHVAGGSEQSLGIGAERFADHLRIAGLESTPADEDPALVAFKVHAVLAGGHAVDGHAVGILEDDFKILVAIVAILDAGLTRP